MHSLDPGAKSPDTAEETTGTENAGTDSQAASGDGEATTQEEA